MSRRLALAMLPLVCSLFLTTAQALAADDILKLVPDSALGFVVLNGPGAADAKLQQLGREMQLPIPSLLARLSKKGGIRDGLDEKGTVALLVLPPAGAGPWPTPILLVPVTDYGKFLAQFKPEDAAAAVTKIELWGAQVCVRKIGFYAALTDASHREALEETLKLSPEVPAALAPWGAWLAEKDVAVVILQPGIKLLSAQVQMGIQVLKSSMGQAGEQAKQAAAAFDIYAKLFQAAEKEVSAAGLGVRLDKQGVLHVTKRARLVPDGSWARLAAIVKPANENLLTGLPAGPFVAAGGGALPEEIWEPLMQISLDMMKSMPNVYGLSAEQVDQMPKTAITSMKKVRGLSMVMGLGPKGTSLYSKMVVVMRVEKSDTFMADYDDAIKQYAEFLKKVDSPVLQPIDVEKTEIDGVRALQMTMKAPKQPAGLQTPQYAEMMEAMFGPGGKITVWAVPADEHTVVIGYVSKEPLQQAIRAIKQGAAGLAGDADVSKTAALLPANAPWIGLLSPRGTIEFAKQMIPAFAPPGAKAEIKIPEFAKTPPIGFAVTTAPGEIQGHMVVPAEVLKEIGQYAANVKSQGKPQKDKVSEKGCPVSGKVTLDGKPLAAPAKIGFGKPTNADPKVSAFKSKIFSIKEGKFEGRLEPGKYRVSLRAPSVPQKYVSPQTSSLTAEVREGSNTFNFDLKSD
jgi:hypothetical protein